MSYITNNDIEERLGGALYVQLTDDAGTGSADTDKVDEARVGAEGVVDSYLSRRYAVPVATSGDAELAGVLKSVSLDVAEYRLHARRPPVPADVISKYREAIGWLERMASGSVTLPSLTELPGRSTDGPVCEGSSSERIFSREDLENL